MLIDGLERKDLELAWYMPLLGSCFSLPPACLPHVGVIGSSVAMSTPAGGGVFYFPALTLLKTPAKVAIAFNYATQVTGMGIFGTFHWVRKSYSSIMFWIIGWVTLWGCGGALLTMFAIPIANDIVTRIIFAVR